MSRWHKTEWDLLPERAFQPRFQGPFASSMGMTLEGGGGGRAPDPNPGMIAQAQASEKVGMRALDLQDEYMKWSQSFYDDLKPTLKRLADQEYDIAAANKKRADEYAEYEKTTFRPLEQRLVKEAEEYSTEAKREQLASQAASDVQQAYGVARDQNNRSLTRMGVNPNAARFGALNNQMAIRQAADTAGAMTKSRQDAEALGFARRMDAAGLGRNLAPNASTAYGISLNASGQARDTTMTGGNFMSNAYGQGSNMLGQATNAYGTAGNIYGQEFNARMQGYQAKQQARGAMMQGLGTAAGMWAGGGFGMPSSEDYKKEKKGLKRGEALEGINNLDVERWKYKASFEDDREHIGPYAEDFKREFGVGTEKEIDIRDALGVTMKAVQDLTAEVRGLRKANGGRIHKGKGPVSGPGGPVDDKVPAMLSDGEYVLPADTVKKVGADKLDRLVKETHTPAVVQRARKRRGLKGRKK